MPLRILIADDHDLLRRGVRVLVESHPAWEVCGEAATGCDAIRKSEALTPDVAILDVSMPDLNGVDAARQIHKLSPKTEILILSMHFSDQLIREVVDAGARGFIMKSDSDRDLLSAVETLAKHKPYFDTKATEVILKRYNVGDNVTEIPHSIKERLTPRELEIVRLLAEGRAARTLLIC